MPFIAYMDIRTSARLGLVSSRLFNEIMSESVSDPPIGWPHDHGPTNVGAMVKTTEGVPDIFLIGPIGCLALVSN